MRQFKLAFKDTTTTFELIEPLGRPRFFGQHSDAALSSRLAEFGGRRMSFNICRATMAVGSGGVRSRMIIADSLETLLI
jgi:hypothetical protein